MFARFAVLVAACSLVASVALGQDAPSSEDVADYFASVRADLYACARGFHGPVEATITFAGTGRALDVTVRGDGLPELNRELRALGADVAIDPRVRWPRRGGGSHVPAVSTNGHLAVRDRSVRAVDDPGYPRGMRLLRFVVPWLALIGGCSLARAPIGGSETDVPRGVDAPLGIDVPPGVDAPAPMDTPSAIDVPMGMDAPLGMDTPLGMDVPARMDTPPDVPAIRPDVPMPPDAPPTGRDAGGAGSVFCGTSTCLAPQVCCVDTASGATSCTASGACGGPSFACDGPEDCSAGTLCCGSFAGGGMTACRSSASCMFRICRNVDDCSSGDLCCPGLGGSGYCRFACF